MTFIGSPIKLRSGDLRFFYLQVERFNPEVGIPMKMAQSNPDGSNIRELRPEQFRGIALWFPDGSQAVMRLWCCEEYKNRLVLVPADGSAIQVLLDIGEKTLVDMTWGP
jgi:hypothetical protein